jgi:antirestriction protein ArdC
MTPSATAIFRLNNLTNPSLPDIIVLSTKGRPHLAAKADVYEIVTNKIIESLEKGTVPWHQPWTSIGGPRNLQSKRPYRGINAFLLGMLPYSSPFWTTYKGAAQNNAVVRKGEKGTLVVFWRILEVDDPQAKSGKKKIPMLRYYTVFNVEQLDPLDPSQPIKLPKQEELDEFDAIEDAEQVLQDFLATDGNLKFIEGGNRAVYRPTEDSATVPARKQFESAEGFYATTFHELGHATGHESRLGRVKDWTLFGTDPYAKEELVAEMCSAMVCGTIGIDNKAESSAAYIASWLKVLKDDKKFVVSAGAQAQKAADLILGRSFDAAGAEAPAQEVAA